ncbi:ABC-type dipeptide transport system, periplasmic component [Beggiatoa alba B18LD]|uniref:ABC-type dipeptide transport system, periplasmic component n=1 Tax=Beggiatoa alba B18LD TaxID=395493 RepID=I3CBZ6_9GAMM|nr:ABC transporter substrate-binding protein [Beggiatoa alba]EIJ41139.1 ABC-type dipeptide transport system, periplasmic component [Beggiatoa alba B18LD]
MFNPLKTILMLLFSTMPFYSVMATPPLSTDKVTTEKSTVVTTGSRYEPLTLRADDSSKRTAPALTKGSHLKVYLPSLPYLYISHAINGALFRPANNTKGWDFDLATTYRQLSETVYEFTLRQGVVFQDGTPFNADAVLLNMHYFKQKPFTYSKIHQVFDHAEKVDDYTVRFYLTEKYGVFLNDVVWIQFYTKTYLEKFGWNGKPTCPNLAEAGLYGLGPYILTEGYIEGDRKTPKAELVANPLYWDKRYPKIERVTIYTELDSQVAKDGVLYKENALDITPIAFSQKVETILSPYGKLVVSPSTDNYTIHINTITGNERLKDTAVRLALNQALHQHNLLYFTYDGEGELSPVAVSPQFPGVREAMQHIQPFSVRQDPYTPEKQEQLKKILNGLTLKVLTQERFMFLWRGIEYQLNKVGVNLEFSITNTETTIFQQLLSTRAGKNTQTWDLLSWGNDDWFFYHPWTVFFTFRTSDVWSTMYKDPEMENLIDDMFKQTIGEAGYNENVLKIMQRAYDNAYLLFIPTPNKVFAVNKEVIFTPYKMASLPLWEIELSTMHPSIRQGAYPEELKKPVEIVRKNF